MEKKKKKTLPRQKLGRRSQTAKQQQMDGRFYQDIQEVPVETKQTCIIYYSQKNKVSCITKYHDLKQQTKAGHIFPYLKRYGIIFI